MFKDKCPHCNAEELEVISGNFQAYGMKLCKDGFAFADAKQVDTDDENVRCRNCGNEYDLGELTEDK